MNRLKQHPALAVLFALALLVGGYGTVRAQQAEVPQAESRPDATACPMMGEGGMMGMEGMDMQAMMERCPMMQTMMEAGEGMNGMMGMMSMMENCPMMAQMMESCPMMQGMMRSDSTMQHQGMMQEEARGAAATATMDGGVQTAEVAVGPMGFEPQRITLEAGVPTHLVFTRTADSGCTRQVQIPAFGIENTDLPLGEPVVIGFTPDEAGTFAFACGMGMVRGTIVVEA